MAYAVIDDLVRLCAAKDLVGTVNDAKLPNKDNDEALTALADADIETTLNQFLEEAASFIDGYVVAHVDTSDNAVATILTYHNAVVALYNLFARKFAGENNPQKTRYEQSIKWLEGVAAGKIQFGRNPELPTPSVRSNTESRDRTFTDDSLAGFV